MRHLVWFRNDLRIQDNPALTRAMQQSIPTIAVFCWTPKQWGEHGLGARKIDFIRRSLEALAEDLEALNVPLKIIEADFKSTPTKFKKLCEEHKISQVFWNREYELNERNRDKAVYAKLEKAKITCQLFDDQVLIGPEKILNQQGKVYGVFTPFKKALYHKLHNLNIEMVPFPEVQKPLKITSDAVPEFEMEEEQIAEFWPAGSDIAKQRLLEYCSDDIYRYKEQRDFPNLNATSLLSAYLAVGAISPKQCFLAALNANNGEFDSGDPNVVCWISELVWRDFYRYILFHHPKLCKSENYQAKYDGIRWRTSKKDLEKWQQGLTGFPIIDAAMRQLNQTGWMHNRLRMIVAMFLTKNLLMDWREGEAYFLEHLIDADYASNNGGWQWSASTGTDAAPYFRVFNPIRQSEKFDPEGEFIKAFCPELSNLSAKQIHEPSAHLSEPELKLLGYPKAMCDLNATRKRAIEAFKEKGQ